MCRGPTVRVDLHRAHLVELLLDPRVHQARIVVDGRDVLEPFYVVAEDEPLTLGRARPEDPVEARFSGSLTNLPADKPFCRGLARRGQLPHAVGQAMRAVYPAVRP